MFVVFDVETTGLSTVTDDILQFAYILFDSNNQFVRAENLYFYKDGMAWNQEVADKTHKLSLDFLHQYKDDFEANVAKMYATLNHANVCGHNVVGFDCPFVKNWLARQGLFNFEFGIVKDTMRDFKPLTKKSRISLTNLRRMFAELDDKTVSYTASVWFDADTSTFAHDARFDVAATALLTIYGIRKGLIRFVETTQTVDEFEEDINLVNDEDTGSLPVDSHSFVVNLGGNYHAMNHDPKHLSAIVIDDVDKLATEHKLIPMQFNKSGDNWILEDRGTTFTVTLDPDHGDKMTIKTPYGSLSSADIDPTEFIGNYWRR